MCKNIGRTILDKSEKDKWDARHRELSAMYPVTGLFKGWVPDRFATSKHRILYVGKATSGDFTGEDVECESFNKSGPFWSFAREIAKAVGRMDEDLSCIAWSNVSKVSYSQIRAETKVLKGFEHQAGATLETEIAVTKPHVIVFVTGHFGEGVVRAVAHGSKDRTWKKSENFDVWWKCRPDGIAVLRMRHPMGAKAELRAYAAAKIALLAGEPHSLLSSHEPRVN